MDTAKERAMEYAGWTGYSGVRLLEVSEAVSQNQPMPMMRSAIADAAMAAPTPIEPGLVGTSVTVTVKYEMVK